MYNNADSFPDKLLGKPKNTEVDSLSLLQEIFLTQELNKSLLHCRQNLYQLSYREAQILFDDNLEKEEMTSIF